MAHPVKLTKYVIKPAYEGFSLLELVVVVGVLGILAAIAIPAFNGITLSARQSAAITYVDAILKSSSIFRTFEGRWPSSWDEIQKYSGQPGTGPLSQLESCDRYGSQCNGNERVVVNGQYLINFWSQNNEIRVSAWRFNNTGPTSQNRSVWGCSNTESVVKIVAWKTDGSYWQGPAWQGGMADDSGDSLVGC